jgi:hypothetical protein
MRGFVSFEELECVSDKRSEGVSLYFCGDKVVDLSGINEAPCVDIIRPELLPDELFEFICEGNFEWLIERIRERAQICLY